MAQISQERTIKVGVVGGGFGRTHILAYQATPGVEVTAFCQRTQASAERVAREFGIPHVFTDYREMFSHADLDAVSLTTPTNVHLAMAREAFDHGRLGSMRKTAGDEQGRGGGDVAAGRRSAPDSHDFL